MAIDWANLKVSKAEADATLRDSVNKFYEHEKNNPAVSYEECIESTAKMAEGYLNYMDNFDEAQAAEPSQANDGLNAGSECGTEGGMNGGMDGGAGE